MRAVERGVDSALSDRFSHMMRNMVKGHTAFEAVVGDIIALGSAACASFSSSSSSESSASTLSSSSSLPGREEAEKAGELSGLGSCEYGKPRVSGYGVKHLGGRGRERGEI